MNPQLAFLALSKAENLQILSCLRKSEQDSNAQHVCGEEDVKICLECLHSETGISRDSLSEGLSLLVQSGLIRIKYNHKTAFYQRNQENLKKLAGLLGMKSFLTPKSQNSLISEPIVC